MKVVPAAAEYDVLIACVSTPSPLSIKMTESPLSVEISIFVSQLRGGFCQRLESLFDLPVLTPVTK
jgi:hypothetical protein